MEPEHNPIREGQTIPSARFHVQSDDGWSSVDARDFFRGRRVVVFALPGAFTPTCSSSHLPRYEELADRFAEAGIDEIYCLSVNDPFVMEAWGREQGTARVRLIADGNAEFTRAVGMATDKEELGFGVRSWRYAMVLDDGGVEAIFVEPRVPGDPFEVSDADNVLRAIAPNVRVTPPVTLFTRPGCPHCRRARQLLEDRGMPYDEIVLGRDAKTTSLLAITGATSVPQVFIGGRHVGGADELQAELAAA